MSSAAAELPSFVVYISFQSGCSCCRSASLAVCWEERSRPCWFPSRFSLLSPLQVSLYSFLTWKCFLSSFLLSPQAPNCPYTYVTVPRARTRQRSGRRSRRRQPLWERCGGCGSRPSGTCQSLKKGRVRNSRVCSRVTGGLWRPLQRPGSCVCFELGFLRYSPRTVESLSKCSAR